MKEKNTLKYLSSGEDGLGIDDLKVEHFKKGMSINFEGTKGTYMIIFSFLKHKGKKLYQSAIYLNGSLAGVGTSPTLKEFKEGLKKNLVRKYDFKTKDKGEVVKKQKLSFDNEEPKKQNNQVKKYKGLLDKTIKKGS